MRTYSRLRDRRWFYFEVSQQRLMIPSPFILAVRVGIASIVGGPTRSRSLFHFYWLMYKKRGRLTGILGLSMHGCILNDFTLLRLESTRSTSHRWRYIQKTWSLLRIHCTSIREESLDDVSYFLIERFCLRVLTIGPNQNEATIKRKFSPEGFFWKMLHLHI